MSCPITITFVTLLFIGLALQNKNKGMKANLANENVSMNTDPDVVAFGHLQTEARIRPM